MRNRNTIEYLGIWETLYNPSFKPIEFEGFKKEAGLNAFTLSPSKWIDATGAIGIVVKSGRYGGTYAHKDIEFKFASWISVEFELYFIKEFQRLKTERYYATFFETIRISVNRLELTRGNTGTVMKNLSHEISNLLSQSVQAAGVINLFDDFNEEFSLA